LSIFPFSPMSLVISVIKKENKTKQNKPGVVVHVCYSIILEAEVGRSFQLRSLRLAWQHGRLASSHGQTDTHTKNQKQTNNNNKTRKQMQAPHCNLCCLTKQFPVLIFFCCSLN
jgi:hypothetical protein